MSANQPHSLSIQTLSEEVLKEIDSYLCLKNDLGNLSHTALEFIIAGIKEDAQSKVIMIIECPSRKLNIEILKHSHIQIHSKPVIRLQVKILGVENRQNSLPTDQLLGVENRQNSFSTETTFQQTLYTSTKCSKFLKYLLKKARCLHFVNTIDYVKIKLLDSTDDITHEKFMNLTIGEIQPSKIKLSYKKIQSCQSCKKKSIEIESKCSGCNSVYYCDHLCQKLDWSVHKLTCLHS
jgi:hypothetical protein